MRGRRGGMVMMMGGRGVMMMMMRRGGGMVMFTALRVIIYNNQAKQTTSHMLHNDVNMMLMLMFSICQPIHCHVLSSEGCGRPASSPRRLRSPLEDTVDEEEDEVDTAIVDPATVVG